MELGKTDATLRKKNELLQELKTFGSRLHVRKWLRLVYQHAEAADQSYIASRKAYAACWAANGCTVEEEELPERPRVEISWECYVRLITLAEIGYWSEHEPDA